MLTLGQIIESRHHITDAVVRTFAEFSGDKNPIHLDAAFAAQSQFGRRIAHGIISGTYISALIASRMPGTIYLGQSYKFVQPVFVDEWIRIQLKVTNVRADKPIAQIETLVFAGEEDRLTLEGEAVVRFPKAPLS